MPVSFPTEEIPFNSRRKIPSLKTIWYIISHEESIYFPMRCQFISPGRINFIFFGRINIVFPGGMKLLLSPGEINFQLKYHLESSEANK